MTDRRHYVDFSEFGRPRLARFVHFVLPQRAWNWLESTAEEGLVREHMQRQAELARHQLRTQLEADARARLGLDEQ